MAVTRRSFLKRAGSALVTVVAAPLFIPAERLEFGVPKLFVPPPPTIHKPKPFAYFVNGDDGIQEKYREITFTAERMMQWNGLYLAPGDSVKIQGDPEDEEPFASYDGKPYAQCIFTADDEHSVSRDV